MMKIKIKQILKNMDFHLKALPVYFGIITVLNSTMNVTVLMKNGITL